MAIYLEYKGYSVELPVGETLVGRDLGCTLRFNDSAVSRRHLKLSNASGVSIEELGSTNGTRLNGEPLTAPTVLHDRDVIELGSHSLVLRITDDDAAQPSTRRLASLADLSAVKPSRTTTPRVTAQVAVVPRCPRCTTAVSGDGSCLVCGYEARARTPTIKSVNRRIHDRQHVELRLVYSSSELEIEATTHDLSGSGVFVCTQVLDPLGTRCELTILVDGGPPLTIQGIVRRVVERGDPIGLGIQFLEVDDDQRAWIDLAAARMGRG